MIKIEHAILVYKDRDDSDRVLVISGSLNNIFLYNGNDKFSSVFSFLDEQYENESQDSIIMQLLENGEKIKYEGMIYSIKDI